METINVSSPRERNVFDISKCLFCQEDEDLVSNPKGCTVIKQPSEFRNDDITKLLNDIGSQEFFYHVTNKCYKRYTNKTALHRIIKKQKSIERVDNSSTETASKRPRDHGRPPPNPDDSTSFISYSQKCIHM